MKLGFPSPEFDDTVAAVCHGSATEAEMRALNELLRSEAPARDEYLMRVELHARLASDPDLFSRETEATADYHAPPLQKDDQRGAGRPRARASIPGGKKTRVLLMAVGLVVAALGVWSLWSRRSESRNGAVSTAVAMLTRTVDARWDSELAPPRVGRALEPGWLRLESGLAQVVFYSGARVVIEGPSELRLVSEGEAVCRRGQLLAEVPPPARGFILKTERLEVLDLGTAFGLEVTEDQTEVHVFEGAVRLRTGSAPEQPLSKGQAVVVEAWAGPRLMAASEEAFAAMFEFQQRSLALEALRYERWQFANARLNQDPSLIVHLDFEALDGSDWMLRNTAERDRAVPDATIVGCQRGEGRWREKQALEFQNVNDRVRLVVPGEFDALTLAAWVCVKGLDRKFNSLFMCDGFAPRTIHWLIRKDGVLGLTIVGERPGDFQIFASPPVLPFDQFGLWQNVAVVLDGNSGRVSHYVNGELVSEKPLRIQPPFRIDVAELGNWNARGVPGHDAALIRNFSGAMDEFFLFSRALGGDEIRALYDDGRPQCDLVADR